MTISERGYKTLCKIRELGEVEVTDLIALLTEFDVKNAVNSLKRGGLIEPVKSVRRSFKDSRATRVYAVSVYAVTERGYVSIQKFEDVVARKAATSNPPTFRNITPSRLKAQKQELHPMQNWIIPELNPSVTEEIIEVNGAKVKCTKGVQASYVRYVQPTDHTRHVPRPIKGIHAL